MKAAEIFLEYFAEKQNNIVLKQRKVLLIKVLTFSGKVWV